MTSNNDILFEVKGRAGIITLNKPKTLNAVTDAMLSALNSQLDSWENDNSISRVIIKAAKGRAFSAGGDIRHLYECGIKKQYDFKFFAREYALNARIANFHKPYIALVDGLVMGGGVGVSFHGSHRIAGEAIGFAMPEVGIGFFPDVGASYFLSRLKDSLGIYLGLTGARVKQADALWSGLATHGCKSQDFEALEEELCDADDMEAVLTKYAHAPQAGMIETNFEKIALHYQGNCVDQIIATLQQAAINDEWAKDSAATLLSMSPTSLMIAYRQIKQGSKLTMKDCMKMEYRILHRILVGNDFYEGIRAAIIDKDNLPKWTPSALVDIDPNKIDAHFADLGVNELQLS
ncbi:MAG: enoyl-CoA hydratase/isomerase family protein [Rhizobiaceae bacterium]